MTATVAAAVGLLATLIATPALADCDYEDHRVNDHRVVPEWSYSHVVTWSDVEAPFPQCEYSAEGADCEAQGLNGYGCALEMQRLYASCVALDVCREAAQGWLEDDQVTGNQLGAMYDACVSLVTTAGGSF